MNPTQFLTRASFLLADHTDEQLVAVWTTPRTDRLRPIPLADLQAYLLAQDLQRKLEAAAADAAVPDAARNGIARFLALLAASRLANLSYDQAGVRADAVAVLGAMVQLGRMTADQATAIRAMGGGDPYTFASEDGLGTDAAHFAAARAAKARRDAIAANRPAVDAALDAWEAAEVAKVNDWVAGGFSGPIPAAAAFTV